MRRNGHDAPTAAVRALRVSQSADSGIGPETAIQLGDFRFRFLCVLIRRSYRVASRERAWREINWIWTGHCEQYYRANSRFLPAVCAARADPVVTDGGRGAGIPFYFG